MGTNCSCCEEKEKRNLLSEAGAPLPGEDGLSFPFTVERGDLKLGMDIKQIQGALKVVQIFPDGAIARANAANRAASPPAEELRPGDLIKMVNGICGSDELMVKECKEKSLLRFRVSRI
eukprot:gnl/TRDRNA2_/TRDRNA2_127976_c0_seq1.p2 gnl/TRDRNA2_/TRDRNA2_127976_c0~~gnl/TRDRNA2_/TRDRNA2_127976_c0_seq1.p2  ORF type:complete len:119 (+),score=24.25 gnl/TRDRNA2_/TRDRNA2_127976_c0_seq1:76-432(+)